MNLRPGAPAPASRGADSGTPKRKAAKGPRLETIEGQSLGRVGIIALVGFGIGIAWPRLAGVSLVPEAPVEHAATIDADEPDAPGSALPQEPAARELKAAERLSIGRAKLTSCRDKDGKAQSSCGELDVDVLVHPTLLSLTGCPAAAGAFGSLSLGFDLDFSKRRVQNVQSGRSTDLPAAVTQQLLRCAEDGLASLNLTSLSPQHAHYTVFYVLEFKSAEEAVAAEGEVTPATGKGTVRWQTALIRQEATRDGEVLARLLAGTEVVVTGKRGEWYRIKYDARGREGWVHGAALGL